MKGVDLMAISFVVSYLLLIVGTVIGGIIYIGVATCKFTKLHNINVDEYIDNNLKYLYAIPNVKWYVVVVRVLLTPVWYPPNVIRIVKDLENAYLDSIKRNTFTKG